MEDATAESATAASDARVATAAAIASPDKLFQLCRNKAPKDGSGARLALPHDRNGRVIDDVHARVCEPSVFHLPVVYDDLQLIAKDLQHFVSSASAAGPAFQSFLNQFISHKWIPKVKAKAQVRLVSSATTDERAPASDSLVRRLSLLPTPTLCLAIPRAQVPQLGHDDAAAGPVRHVVPAAEH